MILPPLSINKLGRWTSIILYYLQLSLAPPANNIAMTLINKLTNFALLIFIFSTSTVSICFSNNQNRFASLKDTIASFIILLALNKGLTDLIFYLFFFCKNSTISCFKDCFYYCLIEVIFNYRRTY
jgi:hypothetical protein